MARIVDSLKNFYKKQGGTPSDVRGIKSISGVIDKIANLSLGGGGGSQSEYVFDFDLSQNGGGEWIATPRQGVTYAAVIAACAETKNVYFVAHAGDNETIIASVNKLTSTASVFFVSGTTIIAINSIEVACKLSLNSNDRAEVYITPLATAQS